MSGSHHSNDILGEAPPLVALRRQIRHLASFDSVRSPHVPTVLLEGETGTGKGLVARILHESGPRVRGPFIDVNCAAIPETMLEAELFGFEAGAFTDARRPKPGLFEAASGGTLFLDEIDALTLPLQGKLLKAIEEKSIRRLGAVASMRVDVKLVAATQQNLRELVRTGGFRADLYHRLAVVIITVPPLRERGDDIVLLANHFLRQYAEGHGLAPKRLVPDGCAWLRAYDWPGNVRELGHLMERVTLLEPGSEVGRESLERLCVPLPRATDPAATKTATTEAAPEPGDDAAGDEAGRIRDALALAGGNVVAAARVLGIGRNALRYRMRRYGIERPTVEELAAGPSRPRPIDARHPARASSAVSQVDAAARAVAPRWEQKSVATLAIELTFPDPQEHADTYEPWTAADRWLEMIEEKLEGFGGLVTQRSPARISAIFGVPRALEQSPERAVQAALAVRRLAPGEPDTLRPEMRIAAHVGSVRVDVGAQDPARRLLPMGDTITLPERLLGHAGAGEVLISPQLARRVAAVCELRPRELHVGPAGAPTLGAFAVAALRRRATAAGDGADVEESRFVGRRRELEILREAFQEAAAGHGRVVLLVGDPGIGKSRLLAQLRRELAGEPHLWIEGRCASYGAATAFLPIADALRRYVGIDDRDDEASAGAKIERAVTELGGDHAWTLPFLRGVLSLPVRDAAVTRLDSATRRSETFRALKTLVLQAAVRRPVVLVVEDLHWIDPASEEYLTFLAAILPATRALLVCTYRPGYQHPFGDRSDHVHLGLRPLSSQDMAAITGSLLGAEQMPAELQRLIAAKAEGNPFFVEEVTKSLLENGALRREDGRVVLARDLADIAVPDSIQDVLSARIDRLAEASRHAIQVASVIGREFALRLLERITEAGTRVRPQVEELRALELIYEKALHPELAYMFKHALTHDVAYESVVVERRQALHRTIGLAIEELYADRLAEHYETLAHHFGRGEDWERALRYHERAAEKAAESYANHAVVEHCRKALAIADRPGTTVSAERRRQLEERRGLAYFYLSEYAESARAFEHAARLATEPAAQVLALAHAALGHVWGHAYAPSQQAIDTALTVARRHHLAVGEAMALNMRGFCAGVFEADVAGYERHVSEALAIAERCGDEGAAALARFYLAQHAEWTGDYRRALELGAQAIAGGRRLRLAHLVVWPAWFLGKAHCCLGDYGRSLGELEEAYRICDSIGDRAWKCRLLNTLGWCLAEIGAHARARAANAGAAALARELGDPEILANSEINLAANHLAGGDLDAAAAHLEPIEAMLATSGDPWMRWRYSLHALHARAAIEQARREPERALVLVDQERGGCARQRAPRLEVRALLLRGHLLTTLERPDDAMAALDEALALSGRIQYRRGAMSAHGMLATLAHRAGRAENAAAALAQRDALARGLAGSLADEELRRHVLAAATTTSD